jgi:hypothetical protein
MQITELFGKTITRIFAVFGEHEGWLDTADCLIELDRKLVIGFPFTSDQDVWIRDLPANAEQLFTEITPEIVIGKKLVDFIWYDDDEYGGYFLLDDGSLITETRMSPRGTGQAGLNYLTSLQELQKYKGVHFNRLIF